MNIICLGKRYPRCANTLIEGEYIREHNLYLAYDILYYLGKDIRQNLYMMSQKGSTKKSRQFHLTEIISGKLGPVATLDLFCTGASLFMKAPGISITDIPFFFFAPVFPYSPSGPHGFQLRL